jgi:triosephosphate isomerase
VLNSQGYNFLLIANNLTKANVPALKKANELALFCMQNHIGFYCLTSTGKREVESIRKHLQLDYNFYNTDETTLKTIVRSNPGLLLLKEGTIIGKWHYKDFPNPKFLNKNFMSVQIEEFTRKNEQLTAVCLVLGFLLLMSIIALVLKKGKIPV